MSRHSNGLAIVIGVAVAGIAAVLAVILGVVGRTQQSGPGMPQPAPSAAPSVTGGAPPPGPSGQTIYTARLRKDKLSLDRGLLAYSPIRLLDTAATTQFEVIVTDVGRGPQHGYVTEYKGMAVYQKDVPTGGIVGVQIVGCEDLTCHGDSSAAQPVLALGDSATWYWQITAGVPGIAGITLRVDTYDQGSQQTLSEELFSVGAKVVPTASYDHQQSHTKITSAAKSVVTGIGTVGSIAAAILAVGGLVGWIITKQWKGRKTKGRRRSKKAQRTGGKSSPPSSSPLGP